MAAVIIRRVEVGDTEHLKASVRGTGRGRQDIHYPADGQQDSVSPVPSESRYTPPSASLLGNTAERDISETLDAGKTNLCDQYRHLSR